MTKKLILAAVITLVGGFVLNETRIGSHFRAWLGRVGEKVEDKISPDMELARIRNEVGQLDGDIDKVKGDLAEANVNVRLLHKEVEELREDVKNSDLAVRKHGEVIKGASESSKIQWGYRTVSHSEAKELLMAEVRRHNDLKASLKVRETAFATQEQTRELIEQELQEMVKQKLELTTAVGEMEAEIKLARVEQVRSKYQNDGTRMADIKSSLSELRKRLMVQREKLHIDRTANRSPAEGKSVEEILAGMEEKPAAKAKPGDDVKVVEKH